jgi:hypothetical protein
MHPPERVHRALELAERGLNPTEISRLTGIHRRTVSDWVRHGPPRGRSKVDPAASCPECGWGAHAFDALPPAYTYLLGLYLGDGTIAAHPRGVFKLRVFLDAKYPGIINECADAMQSVQPTNTVRRRSTKDNCVEVYSYSRSWPCLFPQHGPGMKHERPIVLRDWQWRHVLREPELIVRGLIQSDGCRFTNTGRGGWRHPRYSFSNVSDDIKRIFCDACDLLGLRWTVAPPKTVYVSRKADVALLDEFVGPKR